MRVTKRFSILIGLLLVFGVSPVAHAYDEQWGIFQVRQRLDGGRQIFGEYVRRDTSNLFSKRFIDLYRLSYGGKLNDHWGYLAGASFVDFETGGDERRFHQFFLYNHRPNEFVHFLVRIGLEQRQFNNDSKWYWRSRGRFQVNLGPESHFGLAMYDEVFYVPDGGSRLTTGLNENRFGVGPRYSSKNFEAYLYHSIANIRTLRRDDRLEWLQLLLVLSFD